MQRQCNECRARSRQMVYPGEHFDADATPSIRLFSLLHLWFQSKGSIKWVPWQLRMSQRQYQDIIEARTSRALRTAAQLVSSALFDETPHRPGAPEPSSMARTHPGKSSETPLRFAKAHTLPHSKPSTNRLLIFALNPCTDTGLRPHGQYPGTPPGRPQALE